MKPKQQMTATVGLRGLHDYRERSRQEIRDNVARLLRRVKELIPPETLKSTLVFGKGPV